MATPMVLRERTQIPGIEKTEREFPYVREGSRSVSRPSTVHEKYRNTKTPPHTAAVKFTPSAKDPLMVPRSKTIQKQVIIQQEK
jgi:hypothetical protein